jgi:hypothetical protein
MEVDGETEGPARLLAPERAGGIGGSAGECDDFGALGAVGPLLTRLKHLKSPPFRVRDAQNTVNEHLKPHRPSKEPCASLERCHIRGRDAPF